LDRGDRGAGRPGVGLGGDAVADVREDALPYGVDTLVLRIEWPAPARRGYNGRMWRMRPLRGWTGGQGAGGEPSAGAEQGGSHADEGVAIPIVGRVPAASNGDGGTAPNAGGGVTSVAVAFDLNTQGVPVVLSDGSNVPDPNSPTGLLMSPYAGSSNVAERGRRTGATYSGMINGLGDLGDPSSYLLPQLALDLGHGGRFDYQRQGIPILARIIHEKCAIKAKPLISFTTMRMGCLMKFFAMKSLAQVFGGLGRFRAVR